ncbi:hypothetical protein [Serratia quinivorans]|uniref:hypothetical protein n=1 Tax=Serratia quinivorans TaxID=137545 RepID=UPI003981DB86
MRDLLCALELERYSHARLRGGGAIEVKIKGAFGAGALAGTAYVNKGEIEKNFSSGKFYSNNEISGKLIMGLLYSHLSGHDIMGVTI